MCPMHLHNRQFSDNNIYINIKRTRPKIVYLFTNKKSLDGKAYDRCEVRVIQIAKKARCRVNHPSKNQPRQANRHLN